MAQLNKATISIVGVVAKAAVVELLRPSTDTGRLGPPLVEVSAPALVTLNT